jgi:hypothetical protein
VKPVVQRMTGGPNSEARMMKPTTTIPKTASLFRRSLFQASFQSEVPRSASPSPPSALRTSPSPTASSAVGRVMSPSRERTGGSGGVPSGVTAGLLPPASRSETGRSSFISFST